MTYDVPVRDALGALRFAKEFEARVVTESTWSGATRLNEPALRQALRETLDALFADAEFVALFAPLDDAPAWRVGDLVEAREPGDPSPEP